MNQKTNKIITICYLILMVVLIVMLNSSGDNSIKEHGVADDPTAHKEAIEPDAQTAKETLLNQALNENATIEITEEDESKEENPFKSKISPDDAIEKLKQGNIRFAKGESIYPNLDPERRLLAATESQASHAFATVLSCSDSRVPVEAIFDAGVMDIFTVRVAGNVCDGDEIGSIEYGLAHVHTPVVVVLGHTQCGAVTAVTHSLQGHGGHELERNIPKLIDNIEPAVKKVMELNQDVKGDDLIPLAIEENVWTAMEDLFMQSPVTRNFVAKGYAMVVGAIYDIGTGNITWLPEDKTFEILSKVEASTGKALFETEQNHDVKDEAGEEKSIVEEKDSGDIEDNAIEDTEPEETTDDDEKEVDEPEPVEVDKA